MEVIDLLKKTKQQNSGWNLKLKEKEDRKWAKNYFGTVQNSIANFSFQI